MRRRRKRALKGAREQHSRQLLLRVKGDVSNLGSYYLCIYMKKMDLCSIMRYDPFVGQGLTPPVSNLERVTNDETHRPRFRYLRRTLRRRRRFAFVRLHACHDQPSVGNLRYAGSAVRPLGTVPPRSWPLRQHSLSTRSNTKVPVTYPFCGLSA